jgi:hypothetical protein
MKISRNDEREISIAFVSNAFTDKLYNTSLLLDKIDIFALEDNSLRNTIISLKKSLSACIKASEAIDNKM